MPGGAAEFVQLIEVPRVPKAGSAPQLSSPGHKQNLFAWEGLQQCCRSAPTPGKLCSAHEKHIQTSLSSLKDEVKFS